MNRILALSAFLIILTGCSGGNAGSSSGSGGADPDAEDDTGTTGTTDISSGEYNGSIDFSSINDTAPITIEVEETGSVTVTSNDSGSATGNVSGGDFTASGTISFNLASQTCTGLTNVQGSSSSVTSLSGTVSIPSAECVEGGVSTTITLDGTFSASQ